MLDTWLARHVAERPDHLAFTGLGPNRSFAELNRSAEHAAESLASRGIGRGDRVAIWMVNSQRYVEFIHAISRLGATAVLLHRRLDENTARRLAIRASARILLTDRDLFPLGNTTSIDLHEEKSLKNTQAVLFTSGTTGEPKIVRLTYRNHLASAEASAKRIGINPEDRWLVCMPLYHVGGLAILMRSAIYGTTVVLRERFEAENIIDALQTEAITLLSVVPTMLLRLLRTWKRDMRNHLRCVLVGGGPIAPELVQRAIDLGIPIAPTYGLTEAASQVATSEPSSSYTRPYCVGPPLPGTDVKIEAGEILVRSATLSPDVQGEWLRTGDFGHLDATGRLYVVDRRDDLIVSGGENISPAEIEAVLLSQPSVTDAAAVATCDEEWGHLPVAFVVTDGSLTADQLLMTCQEQLPRFKVPRELHFVDKLPRTASGKLQRYLLREHLQTKYESR